MSEQNDDIITIGGTKVARGENATVLLKIGKLPSGNSIHIQAHIFRALELGPKLLLIAGVHGDEINGVEILRRFLYQNEMNKLLRGTVIIIPLLNIFGFINFSRFVPDGKDVNRSFPGIKTGSMASRVAHAITKQILPSVDYAIDLHTGGSSRYNFPQIRYSKRDEIAYALGKAFGAPFMIQKAYIADSFRKVANDMGVSVLVYEAGEAIRFDGLSIDIGYKGILRVLYYLEMMTMVPDSHYSTLNFSSTGWIRASDSGIFLWSKSSGQKIFKGEPLGEIMSPFGERVRDVQAKRDGYIIGHNNASVVSVGDALFNIGYDAQEI